jgi:cyclase
LAILVLSVAILALPALGQSPNAPQKLATGVWAAQPPRGSNVGWFLFADGVVAVDSGGDAASAKEILKQIAETTGRKPVRYLVLTHSHADHSSGLRAFAAAGAQVICHENAAAPILAFLTQAKTPDPDDPLAAKPNASRSLLTTSERLILSDGKRRVDIQWLGPGHTAGDLVVLLPQEKILFAGDLAPNGRLPNLHLPDADANAWSKALLRLAAVSIDKMVPGHGTIGPTAGIADTLAYLRALDLIVERLVRAGATEDSLQALLREPANRIANVPVSEAHIANAVAMFRRQKEGTTKPAGVGPPASPTPRPTPGS